MLLAKHTHLLAIPEDEHRQALAKAFASCESQGYNQLLSSLIDAYASIGYSRGRNTIVALNKWLMANGYIVKTDKKYSLAQGV